MSKIQVSEVSDIYKSQNGDGYYIYGFTVTFNNGKIRNITRKGKFEDEKIIRRIQLRRQEYEDKRKQIK